MVLNYFFFGYVIGSSYDICHTTIIKSATVTYLKWREPRYLSFICLCLYRTGLQVKPSKHLSRFVVVERLELTRYIVSGQSNIYSKCTYSARACLVATHGSAPPHRNIWKMQFDQLPFNVFLFLNVFRLFTSYPHHIRSSSTLECFEKIAGEKLIRQWKQAVIENQLGYDYNNIKVTWICWMFISFNNRYRDFIKTKRSKPQPFLLAFHKSKKKIRV